MGGRINLDADWRLLNECVRRILNRNDDLPNYRQGVINMATSDYTSFVIIVTGFGERFGVCPRLVCGVILTVADRYMAMLMINSPNSDDLNLQRYYKRKLDYVYHQFRFVLATAANWFLKKADYYRQAVAGRRTEFVV